MAETGGPSAVAAGPDAGLRSRAWPGWAKWLAAAAGAVLALLVVLESYRVVLGNNVHTVIPGKVYRCAQPSKELLADLVQRYGIRSVINLRGVNPGEPWYREESEATCTLDLNQFDVCMSAYRLPSATEWRHLLEVVDRAEYPVLVHCRRGSDRTGLVCAALLLLDESKTLAQGHGQLSCRFGHIDLGRTAHLSLFLRFYSDWLAQNNLSHSAAHFRHWVLDEYRGGPCGCVFEEWTLPPQPVRRGQPFAIDVRLRNSGGRAWQLSPLPLARTHLVCTIDGLNGRLPDGKPPETIKAGFIEARVEPGQTLELRVPFSGLREPGRYRLTLDMQDEQLGSFYQMGSEPLELRLDVCE